MHTHTDVHVEHEHLLEHVEHIRALARELPALDDDRRAERLDAILAFLRGTLLPHARAEETGLYADVARILGDSRAVEPMLHDHRVIEEFGDAVATTDVADTPRIQELLYGLYALVVAHFRKEEELYLPLVEG